MEKLSKEDRDCIDRVVLDCICIIREYPEIAARATFDRPDRFSVVVSNYLLSRFDLADDLPPKILSLIENSLNEFIRIVDASIKRMIRKKILYRELLRAPVFIRDKKDRDQPVTSIEMKNMNCYWPVSVLDRLANC